MADVIAAIQAMGSYPWATRKVDKWAKGLGEPISASDWSEVFLDHPEFFRLSNGTWATLRWRHAYDHSYDPDRCENLSAIELKGISVNDRRDKLTKRPLEADQIEALMKTAVELHTRAIAQSQELRWWIPTVAGLVGVLIGLLAKS